MELTMTNGFTALSFDEMEHVDGGWNWGVVLGGAALVVCTIGVAATAPVSLPILVSGALCASSGLGGVAIGYGATH